MKVESRIKRPVPVVDEDSRTYWEGARRAQLLLPQCNNCGNIIFFPRPFCPRCEGNSLTTVELSGLGKVYSFTVVRFPISAEFEDEVPYVVSLVDLTEGPRILGNILNCEPDDVKIGMDVRVVFEDISNDFSLPQFVPGEQPLS